MGEYAKHHRYGSLSGCTSFASATPKNRHAHSAWWFCFTQSIS
jgi:putative hemolysin